MIKTPIFTISLLIFGFCGVATAADITNLDGEDHILTVTQDGVRSDHPITQSETLTLCESGCFLLFPSGTMLPLSGDESLSIEKGDVVAK